MYPNYMNNQPPAPGYGGANQGGYGAPPPGPPTSMGGQQGNLFNGNMSGPPPPGGYGPPGMKPGFPPAQNGPSGPQGDQFRGAAPPGQGFPNQLNNQFNNMNIQGGPPRPGAPPQNQPPLPPSMPGPPKPNFNQPGVPPQGGFPPQNNMTRPPVSSQGPPGPGGFPPQPTTGGLPPSSTGGGFPPTSSVPGGIKPPSSTPGGFPPPTSTPGGFPPPNSAAGGFPPSGPGGFPPTSAPSGPAQPGGFPPPPSSAAGGFPPPTSSQGGFPPMSTPGGFPPPPTSSAGGFPPPPGPGGFPPPSSTGAPPPSGGFPPPTGAGLPGQQPPVGGSQYSGQNAAAPQHPPMNRGQQPPPSGPGGQYPGQQPPPPGPGGQYPGQQPPPSGPGGQYPGQQPGGQYPGQQPQGQYPAQQPGGQFPGQQPGGYPGGMPSSGPAQPRRLDPDQMPSPIQVIEDDRKSRSGKFQTNNRGMVPPLVTTQFEVEDQGNTNPRMMRSTMYNVPVTNDMLKQAKIPFALSISPFARLEPPEMAPPIVNLGQLGPIRCNRCKGYMNPYMQFMDGGRRFQCAFCSCSTEVPPEYFAHLDHTGRRVDCYDRPELCLGAYEFVATEDYCKNNKLPNPPAFIFMIDVSYNSVKSGLVHLICSRLKEDVLRNLPKDTGHEESEIRVGFVTYHKELHFYNVKGSLTQPQMLIVSDIQDVFVPLLDGFLVKLDESEAIIDSLLEQIPQTFGESRETEIVLGPVIQAGLDALKAADCAGKLFIFHSSLPTLEAPGVLKNRDDRKLLGTEKEKTLLTPGNSFYTGLGKECVTAGCGVDLFLFANSYIDVASVSEVPRMTGGNVYQYRYFQADIDGQRFIDDLANDVSRPIAFDAIMRVRTSTGIRPVDFLGNFYMSNTTDVEIAVLDCDKSISVEIKHDDKLNEAEGAFAQAAVLYTSVSGQRRLRILNQAFNCCNQMADMFRNCELDNLVNYMAKQAIRQTLNTNPKQVRENIMTQVANILACYRKNCASPSSAGQLILPECMKLLPVFSNCVIKSDALQGSAMMTDDRSYHMFVVNAMNVKDSAVYFYPRLIPLIEDEHELDVDSDEIPSAIRCSYERLKENGVYILENGLVMYMWIGLGVKTEWLHDVFGVQSAAQINIDKSMLQDLDNPLSRRVRQLVQDIRRERHRHLKLYIIRQRDKLESVFQQYLCEDRSASGSSSYVDYLCHIHKEIRSLLS